MKNNIPKLAERQGITTRGHLARVAGLTWAGADSVWHALDLSLLRLGTAYSVSKALKCTIEDLFTIETPPDAVQCKSCKMMTLQASPGDLCPVCEDEMIKF